MRLIPYVNISLGSTDSINQYSKIKKTTLNSWMNHNILLYHATDHRVTKSWIWLKRLSTHACIGIVPKITSHTVYNSKSMIPKWLLSGKKSQSVSWVCNKVNFLNNMERVCIYHVPHFQRKRQCFFQMGSFTVISFCNSDYIWVLHYGCNEAGIYCLNNRSKQIRK